MLKRPGFICELLTDSGYHLYNCSVYWSQSRGWEREAAEEKGRAEDRKGERRGRWIRNLKGGDVRRRGS